MLASLEKVSNAIADFLPAKVNITCSTDFYYDFEKDEIGWSFMCPEQQDKTFTFFFEEILKCPKVSALVYSIYHELGHKMTLTEQDKEDWDYIQVETDDMISEIDDPYAKDFAYYDLPLEREASEWAVNYIRAHYEEIVKWHDEILMPLFEEVYTELNLFNEFVTLMEESESNDERDGISAAARTCG